MCICIAADIIYRKSILKQARMKRLIFQVLSLYIDLWKPTSVHNILTNYKPCPTLYYIVHGSEHQEIYFVSDL